MERLLYIDEHAISADAPPAETWSALLRAMRVGMRDEVVPEQRLVRTGRHLSFADYRLVFELDPDGDGTRLRVRTWATFHGLHGQAFRAFAIGAGAHRFVIRRILNRIAVQAVSRAASAS